MSDLFTYRVVVVYGDQSGFFGASGLYETELEAKAQLLDVARTWSGMGAFDVRADGSIQIVREDKPTVTYSVLKERKTLPAVPVLDWNRFRVSSPRSMTWHTAHVAHGMYDARRVGNQGYRVEFRHDNDTYEFVGAYPTLKEAKREAGYHARAAVTA